MRKRKESTFALFAFTVAAGFLIGTSVLLMNQMPGRSPKAHNVEASYSEEPETIQLDNLRASFEIPSDFEQVVGIQHIDLVSAKGRINIGRTATNYDNLVDYLNEFDSKRKIDVKDENNLNIDGYETVSRLEFYNNLDTAEKSYKIFVDGWVYNVNTTDKALYDELDKIAASFRYLP